MTASPNRWARCVVAGAVAVAGLALAGCGAGHPNPTSTTNVVPRTSTTNVIPRTSTTTVPTTTTTTTDPGTLPQTATEPPTDAAALIARLGPLWSAISSGDPAAGAGVFFPESAYLQLKTGILPNPAGDYTGRLVAFYDLDVAAYHLHVQSQTPAGSGPADLELVAADPAVAAWIPPGACENRYGYWHLPGARLVYRAGGAVHSVGVASLISWRGQWFVVHLGPNPRPSDVGTVASPADGPGVPGPAGGC